MKLSELIVNELNKEFEKAGKEPEWKVVKDSEKLIMCENDNRWRKTNGQYK